MPEISVSFAEGTESVSPEFIVNLDVMSGSPISVSYRTKSGTANEGVDFQQVTGTLIIPAGSTSEVISIDSFTGTFGEVDENFILELFDPVGADLEGGGNVLRTTGVITEGTAISLFVSDPILVEGDSGSQTLDFEVRLSDTFGSALSFDYTTVDGTAEAGSDYTAQSGTLTFSAGQTVKTISVPVSGDTDIEPSEYFSLILTPDLFASTVIGNNSQGAGGIGEILDDDANTVLPVVSVSPATGTESVSPEFDVYLDKASVGPVQISFRTISGSAIDGQDYAVSDGTLIIPAGKTTATITIDSFTGTSGEVDENFTLEIFDPVNATLAGGTDAIRTTGVIFEGSFVSLFVSDPLVIEGDTGSKDAQFEVRLSRPYESDLSFTYTTIDGSAKAGSDYTAVSGTLTFLAGQTVANINVPITGDMDVENSEFFSFVVTPDIVSAAVIANGAREAGGIAQILDDDASSVLPVVSVSPSSGTESVSPQFVVTLDQESVGPVQVNWRTVSDSAIQGVDFTTTSGTLTIPAGSTSGTITIDTFTGTSGEIDETFVLEVFDPVNAVLAGNASKIAVTGKIFEGTAVSLFVSEPDIVEGDSGSKLAVFEIQLSKATASDLTLNYTTADGSAQAGTDYTAVAGSIVIPAGQSLASIEVPILGDTHVESTEFFSLVVTPDIFATSLIGNDAVDSAGIATIYDDDAGGSLPTISLEPSSGTESVSPQFTVTLDKASTGPVEVSYRTLSDSAIIGVDVSTFSSTLIIPAGETTGTIIIDTFTGISGEVDESFILEIFDPQNGVLAGGVNAIRATGTILEGSGVSLFVSEPVILEGDSGFKDAVFEIQLSKPSPTDLTFNYTTVDGTAEAEADYTATSGSFVMPAGQTITTVRVPIVGDFAFEESETFSLVVTPDISAATVIVNDGVDSAGIATIQDDDSGGALPTINIAPASGTESVSPRFVLTLDEPSVGPVEVQFRTVSGTATNGVDYAATDSAIIIPAGETTATVVIDTFTGTSGEVDENFTVEFFNPQNARLEGDSDKVLVNGTILEGSGISMFVLPALAFENDEYAAFEIVLSRPSASDITMAYSTSDGSATAGSDYVAQSGSITFLAGQTVATVFVDLIDNPGNEGSEDFNLTVTPTVAIANGTDGASNTVTILDDDRPGPVGFVVGSAPGSLFSTFSTAQAAALAGTTIEVLNPAEVGNIGSQTVLVDNLTFEAQTGFLADFDLGGLVNSFELQGTADIDVTGQARNEDITGNDGDNQIFANAGDDTVDGGTGDDTVLGADGNDQIDGGAGNDSLQGESGNDTLDGGAGNDSLNGGLFADVLNGGDGNDDIRGNRGNDIIDGGDGNDIARGGARDDSMLGGAGEDTLYGQKEEDTLRGGDDDDILGGGDGDDVLFGDDGNDFLNGNNGTDTLNGGNDNDTMEGKSGDDMILGGFGNDRAKGGADNDTIDGERGNDLLFGNLGDDVLLGGSGIDTLIGGDGNDMLDGANQRDELRGGSGADTLNGGSDDDTLEGGSGADTFEFDLGMEEDVIRDLEIGLDEIEISLALAAGRNEATLVGLGTVVNGDYQIDFGGGDVLTLEGITSAAGLEDLFSII